MPYEMKVKIVTYLETTNYVLAINLNTVRYYSSYGIPRLSLKFMKIASSNTKEFHN